MLSIPRSTDHTADVGVFGGSGFYSFLDDVNEVEIETPYGTPSTPLAIGMLDDRSVAFIARHGHDHSIPAHQVNYRANIWAMASLGIRAVIGPFACGSLRRDFERGDVVIVDQFVDRTTGRASTFFDGPVAYHQPCADPYDAELGTHLGDVATSLGQRVHHGGTVVVIPGPRFSTRAESRFYSQMNWDLVNMTQSPEVPLALEAGLRYCGLGLVTDYDVGLDNDPSIAAVTEEEVFAFLKGNAEAVRTLLFNAISTLPLTPA